MFILILLSMFSVHAKVIFDKGTVIKCPIDNKPVYKLADSVKEGEGIDASKLFLYGTEKHPEKDSSTLCSSIIQTWRGICVYTNSGWMPEECKKVLELRFEVRPTL